MNSIQNLFRKHSTLKNILLTFFLFIINFSLFRVLTPRFKELSGGIDIPDITVVFSSTNIYELYTQFGPAARSYYNYIQLVDLFYPLVYCIFFALLITGISKRLSSSKVFNNIYLIPIITAIFDYGENLLFFIMNQVYPAKFGLIAPAGYLFSMGKWVFFTSMIVIALLLLIMMLFYKISGKKLDVIE